MTNPRLSSRQRNIRIPLLVSAVFHALLAASLVVAAADPSPPRLLKAEGAVLSVSWISVVPADREPAAPPAGRASPPVPGPAAPPAGKEPPRSAEKAVPTGSPAEAGRKAAVSFTPAPGTRMAGAVGAAPAAMPSGHPESGAVTSAALPRYRDNTRPSYPLAARLRGYEGVVLLSVDVSAEGRVGELSVKRSSGYEILDRSALEAVRSWTFEPARRLGQPVRMQVDVPVKFVLRGEESLS